MKNLRQFRNAAGIMLGLILLTVLIAMTVFAAAPPKVGDIAPDFTLIGLDGKRVTLSNITKKKAVALVVLRGFPGYQCPLCTAQVGELIGSGDKFAAANAEVILVYPGPADQLKQRAGEFVAGKNLPKNFRVLLDPDYGFVNRYALRWNAPNETAYPASFVLAKDRKIVFAKISQGHAGRAGAREMLDVMPR